MKILILAGAAAIAVAALPGAAGAQQTMPQNMPMNDGMAMKMNAQQKTMYDAWPMDQRTTFDSWPDNYRTYYWTLTPAQQKGWWALTDDQRTRVYAMAPEQRTAAWMAIEKQMMGMPASNASGTAMAATTAAAGASMGGPRFVSGEVVQSTPASTIAKGEYPLCSATVMDSCINPREAGKNYGNRPLGYWPGKPASEMPGKKPMN